MTEQNDSKTLLHLPADRKTVQYLFEHGFITHAGREYALEWLYPHRNWRSLLIYALRVMAFILILSGLTLYFVSNWENMSALYKFTIVELALGCSLLISFFYSGWIQKGALTCACLLIGAFVFIYTQYYPSPIATYIWFALWLFLIIPWILYSHFALLWMLGIVILNVALGLYLNQSLNLNHALNALALCSINFVILALREWTFWRDITRLPRYHHRYVLLIAVLLLWIVAFEISTFRMYQTRTFFIINVLGWIQLLVLFWFYYGKVKDLWATALIVLTSSFILSTFIVKVIFALDLNRIIEILLSVFLLFLIFLGAGCFLNRISYHFYIKKEHENGLIQY